MHSKHRWLVLTTVSMALFLIAIDMTVLYTALPRLTYELSASASEKLWIINIYALVVAGLLPGLGSLGDKLGHKKIFLIGLSVFGSASLIAAFAATPQILIAARVLLGIGAAFMMPATLSIIRLTFEDERERALAIGIWAAIASGGAALGPVLGGLLLAYFWWGSVFLINVPIVLLTLILALYVVPKQAGNPQRHWDLLASAQIMVALIGLVSAIKLFSQPVTDYRSLLIALTFSLGALILFIRRQARQADPLIDFRLFRNPIFSTGVIAAILATVALIGVELVLGQRLQLVLGLSPLQAGLFILPIPLAAFVAGPVTGLLVARFGNHNMLCVSLILAGLGISLFLLLQTLPSVSYLPQLISLSLFGLGLGAAMTAASHAIMMNAPAEKAGMAASIEEVSYELGGAMGVAILGSLMTAVYTQSLVLPTELNLPLAVLDSLDEALKVAEQLAPETALQLNTLARNAFDAAFLTVLGTAGMILFAAALTVKVTAVLASKTPSLRAK